MKTHTNGFKNAIKLFGRELDSKITYTLNNTTITLTSEDLNSVTPRYEGSILKSVMKELEIDSNVNIAVNTEINYKFGVKVGNTYEYIDYGNYIVYKSEKQEDTGSYKIICYDKLLYSMKAYEDLNITYPITIRNYINAICTKLGLTFSNLNGVFANYDKQIQNELYLNTEGNSIGYTYRDVLDELAQVTASTICINNNDELEIRYITETNDTIDEEYLKNINVNMGEQYGPINTIVLSRSGGADNIYYPEVLPANPIEIKITDNQIMNGNDRYQYMPDIYNKLNGLQYYINDFASTGICYYDLCDRYTISIGNNSYSCVMLNDEVLVTQGLEENIHTNLLEESVTEYKYADTTDRRINQTNLIVDKQNQIMTGIIEEIGDRSSKTTSITADLDGLNSRVEQIAILENTVTGNRPNLTNSANTSLRKLIITGDIEVSKLSDDVYGYYGTYPTSDLAPMEDLAPMTDKMGHQATYVSENTYLLDMSLIHIKPDGTSTNISLPEFTLRTLGTVKDEFVIENNQMSLIQKIGIDGAGNKYVLLNSITTQLGEKEIILEEGDNVIYMQGFDGATLYATYITKNELADTFATKIEMSSNISQTAGEIMTEVNKKVDDTELGTKITQNYESVQIAWNTISEYIKYINGKMQIKDENNNLLMELDKTGQHFYENNSIFGNMGVREVDNKNYITFSVPSAGYGQSIANGMAWGIDFPNGFAPILFIKDFYMGSEGSDDWGGQLVLSDCELVVEGMHSGITLNNIRIENDTILGGINLVDENNNVLLSINPGNGLFNKTINMLDGAVKFFPNNLGSYTFMIGTPEGTSFVATDEGYVSCEQVSTKYIYCDGPIYYQTLTPISTEDKKKNIEKYKESGLKEVLKTDIYTYNYKTELDTDKKKVGAIIGEEYGISKDIIEKEGKGIDTYAMISLAYKAIQEQQEIIEQMKEEIKKLKGEK